MLKQLFGRFSKDIGIDLGSTNTLIYVKDRGIVINEPSVVAVNVKTDQILAVGKEAQQMKGKAPPHIQVISPLEDGIISDFEVCEKMLRFFLDKIHAENFHILPRPRVLVAIPLDLTEVEKKAVEDAVLGAGAREVLLTEQIIAGAIGARLPIEEPQGTMVVDLGGGRTEIAVISLSGIVTWKSLQLAGTELNNDIIQFARHEFNVLLGEHMAEEAKIKIGSATPLSQSLDMRVRGRNLISGLPKEILINDGQTRQALSRSLNFIIDHIKSTMEVTPPELVADIYERGITLVGGGAQLKGIDQAIASAMNIPVQIADDPTTCVVRGTGIILEDVDAMSSVILASTQHESIIR